MNYAELSQSEIMEGVVLKTSFNFDLYDDLDIIIEAKIEVTDFDPGRPAPACSNPSSPFYDDEGEGMDYNPGAITLTVNDKEIVIDESNDLYHEFLSAIDSRLENKMVDICHKGAEI